ncbi:MAG: tetratricopeptide repeat protein [Rhodopseudomonas sp.]|nr:tetratricopeptide repeat protein [Rhodopseudomonas sp.]
MSDIFSEVDEEVRRERLQRLWDRYYPLILSVAVLIVVGIAAWRGYEYWMAQKAAAAGADFEAAVTLSEAGKHAEAEKAFAKVVAEAPAGYALLGRFRAAAELAEATPGKPAEAVKAYDALAGDASLGPVWQDLAALRAGMLLVDSATLADLQKRLDPISAPGRVYRHSARELLALAAWRSHDLKATQHYIDMISGDGETPPGTRQRVELLSALMAANGKS